MTNKFCPECGTEQSSGKSPAQLALDHVHPWQHTHPVTKPKPDLVHHTNDDATVMRILRDIYLTATYHERNRLERKNLRPPFSEKGLIDAAELAFEDLTGKKRSYRDVIDEACRTGGVSCNHCGRAYVFIGLGESATRNRVHAKSCPHWNGGSC